MRKPVYFLIGLSLLSHVFFSCKKDDEKVAPEEEIATPGHFVVSSTQQSSQPNGRVSSEPGVIEFNMGNLLASEKFVFMIGNGGDQPIFDITLTSDNLPFEVSPGFIKLIPGKKTGSIFPLLNVGIVHGIRLKGVGTAPLLPRGDNKAIVRMTGKTISKKDTINVTGKFIIKVNAILLDAKVQSGDTDAVAGTDSWNLPVLFVEPSKTVKLINTGSVAIKALVSYRPHLHSLIESASQGTIIWGTEAAKVESIIELQPDEIKDITSMVSPPEGYNGEISFPKNYYDGRTNVSIVPVKDEGVITNVSNFTLQSN